MHIPSLFVLTILFAPLAMSETARTPRVEIFVDGTNFRIAQHQAGVGEIDVPRLARRLARNHVLVKMRYYTSPLPDGQSLAYRGQHRFFERVRGTHSVDLILGRNEPRRQSFTCPRCGEVFTHRHHVEKETDVNLAVDMAVGAHLNRYDMTWRCW